MALTVTGYTPHEHEAGTGSLAYCVRALPSTVSYYIPSLFGSAHALRQVITLYRYRFAMNSSRTSYIYSNGSPTIEIVEVIDTPQPPPYISRPPSYAPQKAENLCEQCGLWPKVITAQGFEHPFCSKICARKHLQALQTTASPSTNSAPCLGCGTRPQAIDNGMHYPHCSRSCARKWPLTLQRCALPGCNTCITSAFGPFCSPAHVDQSRRRNVLHKKPPAFTPPPPTGLRTGPLSALPQPQRPTQLRHFTRSNPILGSASAPASRQPTPPPKRILFYDKHAPHYGLTNFSKHPVVFEGKRYPTSEHLFQALKFYHHKPHLAEHIRTCSDKPSVAFAEARRYHQEVRPDWHQVNVQKMDTALWHKFTQHPALKAELLATGDAELVEDSPIDAFWGVGHDGRGRNELGKALMRLRKQLRADP
ncbi:putative protein with domain of unknown function (DUF1768) [Lyophyllum shimeji]|uniref:NADAR domain-containing protein n=1 Tax=Lyophyllum shimeji TaxID=47721 RepID=A0A9P3PPJ4_LYOSH|nr:putative protein with domain of unknown function (DUF1768) [Lyophyllum shimeji]